MFWHILCILSIPYPNCIPYTITLPDLISSQERVLHMECISRIPQGTGIMVTLLSFDPITSRPTWNRMPRSIKDPVATNDVDYVETGRSGCSWRRRSAGWRRWCMRCRRCQCMGIMPLFLRWDTTDRFPFYTQGIEPLVPPFLFFSPCAY